MNTLEHNRRIAIDFFRCHDSGNPQGALDLLADDCIYWLAGKPGSNASAGARSKAEMEGIFRRMGERLEGPLRMEVLGTVAEGDRVAVEARSRGQLRNGRRYEQEYHVLMTIRAGKIVAAREYMDTQHVMEIWYTR